MQSIDDVIAKLDDIVAHCSRERLREGYFAALYRHMTLQVKLGMAAGHFEDNARMEHLDLLFASRYFEAFDAWFAGRRPTESWSVAFQAADNRRLTILQQLLLGINAHINLDLGLSAAQTCPGERLPALRNDFIEINAIISALIDQVQTEISEVSPWIALLDRVAGRTDEALVNFSIKVARDEAWDLAEEAAPLSPPQQAPVIERRDRAVAGIGRAIRSPGIVVGAATWLVASREVQDEREVIAALSDRLRPAEILARRTRAKTAATAERA
ncbi:MAG: hypothetical protein K0R39_3681 [Symbiobacteriaceae bacterium]|jgi:hypothetical protein|nr:hypothetical protein [Symbiobacteriaceae bacterium]